MQLIDIINHKIEGFRDILYKDVFSKNDIEDFLKTNPNCTMDYIDEIAGYIYTKYKHEINIYLEIAKCYLNKNINESIKYLEIYKSNGGKNQDALILLMKLYRDTGAMDKAILIAENINCHNNRERIEEILSVYILLDLDVELFMQKLAIILRYIDNYNNQDKKELLSNVLRNIFKKIKNSNYKELHKKELIDKKHRSNIDLKYYLNMYMETANKKFINKAINVVKYNDENMYFLFNDILQLKIRNINVYKSGIDEKKLLKILKNNRDIITDWNKWQIIKILLSYYKENVVKKVNILCDFIDKINGFDWKLSKELGFVLRGKNLSVNEKSGVMRILKKYNRENSNVKYKNIFLNEIEILQNKVVLKSKPRELDITITTRCNLRCIMCDIHELSDYIIDDKMYIYIKNTLPYLENIIWKGGEVFLYNKFYEFINLASQYNVRQTIITNGLLLTDDYVKLIAQYQIELVISIDATDKKTYEKIREGANFNVLINNLKILEKYYGQNNLFKYKMAVVVMSINYNQIEQLINFAILHKFESIHFQACTNCKNKYLLLQDLKKKEVIEQIEKYKNKYKNSIAILTDDTLNMKRFTELRNADLLSVSQTAESKPVLDEKNNYANENLSIKKFCYRPFLKIALNPERNNINFGCGCTDIDVSKYQYDEIWNCSELVQYRKSIVSNDLSICKL